MVLQANGGLFNGTIQALCSTTEAKGSKRFL
jgi:hypothetical protein